MGEDHSPLTGKQILLLIIAVVTCVFVLYNCDLRDPRLDGCTEIEHNKWRC